MNDIYKTILKNYLFQKGKKTREVYVLFGGSILLY